MPIEITIVETYTIFSNRETSKDSTSRTCPGLERDNLCERVIPNRGDRIQPLIFEHGFLSRGLEYRPKQQPSMARTQNDDGSEYTD